MITITQPFFSTLLILVSTLLLEAVNANPLHLYEFFLSLVDLNVYLFAVYLHRLYIFNFSIYDNDYVNDGMLILYLLDFFW